MSIDYLSDSFKYIFVLYLLISSNYIGNLFSCHAQRFFSQNIIVKHILALFTLYFLVVIVDNTSKTPRDTSRIKQTLFVYALFVLSSKVHPIIWGPLIISICTIYVLSQLKLEVSKEYYSKHKSKIEKTKHILSAFSILLLILGVTLYLLSKNQEYGNKFSFFTFILGKTNCSNN